MRVRVPSRRRRGRPRRAAGPEFPVLLGSSRKINPNFFALTREKQKQKQKHTKAPSQNTKKNTKKKKSFRAYAGKKPKKSFRAYARKNSHLPGSPQMSKKRRNSGPDEPGCGFSAPSRGAADLGRPGGRAKSKFTEIEKFGRKKNDTRAGARHVSWGSCQLAAHTRLGRSVGREDRPPQWGVVHEHTPVSIPESRVHEHKNYEFEFSLTDLGRGRQATRT